MRFKMKKAARLEPMLCAPEVALQGITRSRQALLRMWKRLRESGAICLTPCRSFSLADLLSTHSFRVAESEPTFSAMPFCEPYSCGNCGSKSHSGERHLRKCKEIL